MRTNPEDDLDIINGTLPDDNDPEVLAGMERLHQLQQHEREIRDIRTTPTQ